MRTRFSLLIALLVLGACKDEPTAPASRDGPDPSPVRVEGQAQERVRVLVELSGRGMESQVAAAAQAQGARVTRRYNQLPYLALEVSPNALQGLSRAPGIVAVWEDVEYAPSLGTTVPLINADDVHALGWTGAGQAVAILDTGIEADHPFFSGRVVEEACYSSDGADQTSLCPDGSTEQTGPGSADIDIAPCMVGANNFCDHGTHVTGIAAGDGTGIAGAPPAGVAPDADIIAIQVFTRRDLDANCGGDPGDAPCLRVFSSDLIAGLERVLDLTGTYDITSANMSLGGGENSAACDGDPAKTVIDMLRAANVASVIAAGNDGFGDAISSPACISTAVAIGATDNSDLVAGFSNRGPLLHLFAPGSGVFSSVDGGVFGSKSGTSMATPHVTGAWAVLRQVVPTMDVGQAITLFQNTGVPITYLSDGSNVTTPRINLLAALQATTDPPELTVDNATVTVDEGQVAGNTGTFSDPDGDPVTLTVSIGTVTDEGGGVWSWSFGTTDGPVESQTVTVTGTDDKGATGEVTFELVVNNVAPLVDAGPDASITSNEFFDFSGTFTDPGVNDAPWDWTIDWGDGTDSQGTAFSQAFPITDSHQYCAAGPYTVSLTVEDKDGGVGMDDLTLTVEFFSVDIAVKPNEEPTPINLGTGGFLPVAILSSADFDATTVDPSTVRLGETAGAVTPVATKPNGQLRTAIEDVDGDGLPDLLLWFSVSELVTNGDLTPTATSLVLTGFLDDACTNFQGEQPVSVVP